MHTALETRLGLCWLPCLWMLLDWIHPKTQTDLLFEQRGAFSVGASSYPAACIHGNAASQLIALLGLRKSFVYMASEVTQTRCALYCTVYTGQSTCRTSHVAGFMAVASIQYHGSHAGICSGASLCCCCCVSVVRPWARTLTVL